MPKPRNDEASSRASKDVTATRREHHLDDLLDEALKETFPASDPIAVTPPRKKRRRRGDS